VKEPVWLDLQDLIVLHNQLLARFGGMEGIRDEGLLESALNRPVQRLQYEPKTTLPDLADSYAYGLVRNHRFFGGNMRVSLMSAILFLEINGLRFFANEEEAILETLALAASQSSEEHFSDWLARNVNKA
tara:strand:+ start:1626 stop:2015 length:390 start_codon:yes stop_codon:yes gene_type:complete